MWYTGIMHKFLDDLPLCKDCGGTAIDYPFLKLHGCDGNCGKRLGEREAEAGSRGEWGLPVGAGCTYEQEMYAYQCSQEFTDADWDWVDILNGRPAGYTVGLSPTVVSPTRVVVPPLEIDWSTPANSALWAWIEMNNLDKPVPDHRSVSRGDAGIEVVYKWRVLLKKGWNCGICGGIVDVSGAVGDPLRLVFDHIVPLSKGGLHTHDNIQPAHHSCNSQKASRVEGWQDIKPLAKVVV